MADINVEAEVDELAGRLMGQGMMIHRILRILRPDAADRRAIRDELCQIIEDGNFDGSSRSQFRLNSALAEIESISI